MTSPAIRTPDQRLRVFISSTLSELADERRAARQAVEQLRMAPVLFESGARTHDPWALYRAYLEQSDVFVGIYWQRYGWTAPGMTVSGLEDEFQLSTGKPRLLYVKSPAPDRAPGLDRMLTQVQTDGAVSYKHFRDADELHRLVLDDLAVLMSERFDATSARAEPEGARAVRPVPTPATTLVGRDADVAAVAELITSDGRRLVTLTGAGGIGKTRVALAVLERTRPRWPDGVAFVDLSTVTDPTRVPAAVVTALGIAPEGRERSTEALTRYLAQRHVLLVLDNAEHVATAAGAFVAELLGRCPGLCVLATSRVPLRIRGEREWPVGPLGLAPGSELAAVAQAPAVQLFVNRVRDVRPTFRLTSANAAAVAEICRRLDGLPLALELGAAAARLLSPQQLLDRLDAVLEHSTGPVDGPVRQQTLTATLRWSHDLLPAAAQRLLARLSVFSGPFTVDGAEALSDGEGADVVEVLATLSLHSLLTSAERPDGVPAFRLLEIVRTFASARLTESGADAVEETWQRLHDHLLHLLGTASPDHGASPAAMALLDSAGPDLQAVFLWRIRSGTSPGPFLRALAQVWVWLKVRGHMRWMPRLRAVVAASSAAGALTPRDWANVAAFDAGGLFSVGQYAEAGALWDEVLPALRQFEPTAIWATVLDHRAAARPYESGSPAGAEFAEAVAALRGTDDRSALAYALLHHTGFLRLDGDLAAAGALVAEAVRLAAAIPDMNLQALAHYHEALAAMDSGEPLDAVTHLRTAADDSRGIGHRYGVARALSGMVDVAAAAGEPRLAARLLGASDAAQTAWGLESWPQVQAMEGRVRRELAAALPAEVFTSEVLAGRRQDAEAALASAFTGLARGVAPPPWDRLRGVDPRWAPGPAHRGLHGRPHDRWALGAARRAGRRPVEM